MPYKKVKTDDATSLRGRTVSPVATLADEHGGRAQIVIDDHCYMLLIKQSKDSAAGAGYYTATPWWFREAVEVLKDLPLPE